MTTCRRQEGQVTTLAAVFLLSILGMAALVVDAGAWFHAHRAAQAAADAAALAGAQALPSSTSDARGLALAYADDNGGGLASSDITFSAAHDTITVEVRRTAPTFFTRLFGIVDFEVSARAGARTLVPGEARWVAPIAVDEKHPMLVCRCWGQATELRLLNLKKPQSSEGAGAFGLVNLNRSISGDIGAETLGDWILRGYDQNLPLGKYRSSPSTEFNSSHIQNALRARVGDELLFPVYRKLEGEGSRATYDVIGWVAFLLTGTSIQGDKGTLYGSFVRVNWEGIQGQTSSGEDFGVRTIALVE